MKHNPFKQQIKFHWERSALSRKKDRNGREQPVFKPSLNRGETIRTEALMAEFIEAEGLSRMYTPSTLALTVKRLLAHMVQGTLTDGRSRRIDDFFTDRLDMKGTAESINEPYDPRRHKFTINFQKARRFSEKSSLHCVEVLGEPVCEVPLSRSSIKSAHSLGAGNGEVYIGRQIVLEGKNLSLNPESRVALAVDYPVGTAQFACDIVSWDDGRIVVESPKRFEMKYMRESVIGLTGEVILYLNDPRHRRRQAAHGSRFKVKFVRPPK